MPSCRHPRGKGMSDWGVYRTARVGGVALMGAGGATLYSLTYLTMWKREPKL